MSSVIRSAALLAAIACSVSCTQASPEKASDGAAAKAGTASSSTPAEERKRNSTMIGMDIAKSLEPIKDEIDVDALAAALRASFAGKPTGLTPADAEKLRAEFGAKMQAKMQKQAEELSEKNLRDGAAFLASHKNKPGIHTTASGLQYQVLREGNGPMPAATDTVRVQYKGMLLDGTVFDSSYDRGEPAEFALNQVIKGWGEGVALMPVNSKYRFWIPSDIGYGPGGQAPIGPNATLVFDVELLGVVK